MATIQDRQITKYLLQCLDLAIRYQAGSSGIGWWRCPGPLQAGTAGLGPAIHGTTGGLHSRAHAMRQAVG
jgi:hypothetical protein